ncbi:hypothetical protein [Burkholderia cenocepacia]|nr:hypothetical protein [Burkholderia cenocepacia]
MSEQNQTMLEEDEKQIEVTQPTDEELTLALSIGISNKEWQE